MHPHHALLYCLSLFVTLDCFHACTESCVKAINGALQGMDGITSFTVDLENQEVVVEGTRSPIDVLHALNKTGRKSVIWAQVCQCVSACACMRGGSVECGIHPSCTPTRASGAGNQWTEPRCRRVRARTARWVIGITKPAMLRRTHSLAHTHTLRRHGSICPSRGGRLAHRGYRGRAAAARLAPVACT